MKRTLLLYLASGLLVCCACARMAFGQNSFPLADLMPLARGGGLGGQALAGDLLAAGIDPTVASGDRLGVELAAGSHVLDLSWGAAGLRFHALEHSFAVVLSTLSYGSQLRTDFDDRLGIFGGSFTPSDWNVSLATVVLREDASVVGVGATFSFAQLDDASALGLAGAVAVKQRFGGLEIRGGLSNVGAVFSPFEGEEGTRMPARLRTGAAYTLPGAAGSRWEFSGEVLYRFGDESLGWGIGTEWRPLPETALRIGLSGGEGGVALSDGVLSDLGFTAGFSWQFSDWRLSYVYRPGGVLGNGHLMAVGWSLGSLQ